MGEREEGRKGKWRKGTKKKSITTAQRAPIPEPRGIARGGRARFLL
jgi:hypothetical protein